MPLKLNLTELDAAPIGSYHRSTMGSRVFEVLKQAIVQVKLLPGDTISETEVSRQLNVSRQPVREAFIKLADVGLLNIQPQRATTVKFISEEEVINAHFVREAVEAAIIIKSAAVATEADIEKLESIIALQVIDEANNDYPSFQVHDEDFHLALAEISGHLLAWRMIENLKAQTDRVRYLSIKNASPIKALIEQHRQIIDSIRSRDTQGAQRAMKVHLEELFKTLPIVKEQYRELFCPDK